jgi:DNA (cytosine-5)-methyltransferase 1
VKVGSLFSGYGGLDLAVNEVFDASVAWHCEWEDAPSRILEAHFPGVPNFRDVSKVDFTAVEPVDILTGGFPCQDLSLAGKRAGLR